MNMSVRPPAVHDDCEVAIVGAGPYGLATAAHLRAARVAVRAFGRPLSFWRENMPLGMTLRSPWNATHIADPDRRLTLDAYCEDRAMPRPSPLPREDFIRYGDWFRERAVPDLDRRDVIRIDAAGNGYALLLEDGHSVAARRVVIATGLLHQEYMPALFAGLPRALVSHTVDHNRFDRFRGRRVAVIGRGQSACESAVLLHEAGAQVELISRGEIVWIGDPGKRSAARRKLRALLGKALIPPSQVGVFPYSWLIELPGLVHRIPDRRRAAIAELCLRATAGVHLRARLGDTVVSEGREIRAAWRDGDRVVLALDNGERTFDHVLLATGFRPDIEKIDMLAPLRPRIATIGGSPRLAAGLESSLPGLHFVGSSAVASFGPLLRFIAGAGFAARSIARKVRGDRAGRPGDLPGIGAATSDTADRARV
jgi:glycine/D-amino acid oxidase-like deaminating enzyme